MILLAFSLIISMVPFSVALNSSVYRCIEWKETFRMALVFALFQSVMAATGWGIGFAIKGLFHEMQVPVALILLFLVALRLFLEGIKKDKRLRIVATEETGVLVSFGLMISMPTILLGTSIGMMFSGILPYTGFIFGLVFVNTVAGIRLGKLGLMNLGKIAELIGSLGLLAVGIVILLQYLKII
jgi:manganese efflux pump family protein